jgi:UvrB/uvrC motif
MSVDITDILRDWEFDSDNQIRIIQADDGRQVLQVRQPMGIEQYELDGRPDGKRPFGHESMVEEYQARVETFRGAHGTDDGFTITHDDFANLQGEGVLYYFRYLVLFQIGDFVRTARDTDHNLALFSLVEKYGDSDEDRKELLQYKPYVLRMNAIARAMISLHKEMKEAAEDILNGAISAIEGMNEIDTPAFQFERVRSLNYLKATLKQIHEKKDSPLEALKSELSAAIDDEDYEKAAVIRDRIKEVEHEKTGSDQGETETDASV